MQALPGLKKTFANDRGNADIEQKYYDEKLRFYFFSAFATRRVKYRAVASEITSTVNTPIVTSRAIAIP
jgi:hypothetical protein